MSAETPCPRVATGQAAAQSRTPCAVGVSALSSQWLPWPWFGCRLSPATGPATSSAVSQCWDETVPTRISHMEQIFPSDGRRREFPSQIHGNEQLKRARPDALKPAGPVPRRPAPGRRLSCPLPLSPSGHTREFTQTSWTLPPIRSCVYENFPRVCKNMSPILLGVTYMSPTSNSRLVPTFTIT